MLQLTIMRASLLALVVFLAACTPAVPLSAATVTPGRITPIPSATPGVSDGIPLLPLPTETRQSQDSESPKLIIDPGEAGAVITGTFCCGYTTTEAVLNYLPEFQVRADGTYTWVRFNEDGSRQVLQTKLSAEKVDALLERIASAGFFDWKDRYANDLVADFADKCIKVTLESGEKSVCEYYEGAPESFHELFAFLQSGAGEAGQPFVPGSAFFKVNLFDVDFVSPTLNWEEPELPLGSIPAEGTWISGEPLAALWDAVNRAPWGPTIGANGTYYIFTLQLVDLSPAAPPPPGE